MPLEQHETQPSAEIVRVEGAKCRRDCVLDLSAATLCGDRACRGREMQARLPFGLVRRNPLRRSCVSRARNAGEIVFWTCPAQPSPEIVRVEGAKCRRDCLLDLSRATLCGDRACRRREVLVRLYSVWAERVANYVRDVAVPCGLRGLGGKCVCVAPCHGGARNMLV